MPKIEASEAGPAVRRPKGPPERGTREATKRLGIYLRRLNCQMSLRYGGEIFRRKRLKRVRARLHRTRMRLEHHSGEAHSKSTRRAGFEDLLHARGVRRIDHDRQGIAGLHEGGAREIQSVTELGFEAAPSAF